MFLSDFAKPGFSFQLFQKVEFLQDSTGQSQLQCRNSRQPIWIHVEFARERPIAARSVRAVQFDSRESEYE